MTDDERARLHGIRNEVLAADATWPIKMLMGRPDAKFLLDLAARCDAAEREVDRMKTACRTAYSAITRLMDAAAADPGHDVGAVAGGELARRELLGVVAPSLPEMAAAIRGARSPEEKSAVLAGYEPDPCPDCGVRRLVRSGAGSACEACGRRVRWLRGGAE